MMAAIRDNAVPFERADHLYVAVKTAAASLAHLTISTIATLFDFALLGTDFSLRLHTARSQENIGTSLARCGLNVILIVNPWVEYTQYTDTSEKCFWRMKVPTAYPAYKDSSLNYQKIFGVGRLNIERWSVITTPGHLGKMIDFQQRTLNHLYYSGSFLKRHVGVRLFGAASGVAYAIAGVAMTAFGVLATGAAFFTLGRFSRINELAVNNLATLGFAMNQLHQGFIGLFRPSHICAENRKDIKTQ